MSAENNVQEKEEAVQHDGNGSLTIKRNKTLDFIAKILCLIIAFFIWYYVAETDSSELEGHFSSVPVEIVNKSQFSVLSGGDATVDLKISGKRNIINKLIASDIRVFVDMSGITEAGKHKFNLQYELPNGVTLVETSTDSIIVYADSTSSVSVPVEVPPPINYQIDGIYELGYANITTNVTDISVTGPEAVISKIVKARLVVDLGNRDIQGTFTYSGNIDLIDTDGNVVTNRYVKTNVSYVTATIPVYREKVVPITVAFKHGIFGSDKIGVSVEPSSIRIKGEVSKVDDVKIQYVIDEKTISSDTTLNYKISLPDYIENCDSVENVKILVKLNGISTKTVSVYNLEIKNPNALYFETIKTPINLTVCGETELIESLGSEDVTAVIDLSSQKREDMTITLPVTFKFAEQFKNGIYETGTYSVSVKISSEQLRILP
ncbi:MAG: hypothetical protein IJO00_00560 [Clostridia bacterium]|nr:hypothetical protein [Clostridia bacterium]